MLLQCEEAIYEKPYMTTATGMVSHWAKLTVSAGDDVLSGWALGHHPTHSIVRVARVDATSVSLFWSMNHHSGRLLWHFILTWMGSLSDQAG